VSKEPKSAGSVKMSVKMSAQSFYGSDLSRPAVMLDEFGNVRKDRVDPPEIANAPLIGKDASLLPLGCCFL
jgi:hypothetical protein